jgi:hypothetical protein
MEDYGYPKQFLSQYVTERLPVMGRGVFELPYDPPSFAADLRYLPLKDVAVKSTR